MPRVIENLFPHRYSLLGIGRDRLRHLVTRGESRKFGREFNPWGLYKYVSGMNAVRLRKLLASLEGEDYPASRAEGLPPDPQATSGGQLEVPHVDLDRRHRRLRESQTPIEVRDPRRVGAARTAVPRPTRSAG